MKGKIKDIWVKALNSGEYKQTTGLLKDDVGHCCLGVLCELYMKDGNKGAFDDETFSFTDADGNSSIGTPPKGVIEWAGLEHENPDVDGSKYVKYKYQLHNGKISIAELNDGGKTFKEMVEIIQNEL